MKCAKAKKYLKDIPELVEEYDFDKNKDIDFDKITCGSNKKVWWKCEKRHQWQAIINNRCRNKTRCPYCSNRKVCKDNCLATTHSHLTREWSNKNKIKPTEVTYGNNKKVWWECQKGHQWKAEISTRTIRGYGCPYCSGLKVLKENSLYSKRSDLLKDWNYDRNTIAPTEVSSCSSQKVWWKCPRGHEWEGLIGNKSAFGCPYCSGQKVCKDNCLKTIYPELVKEWSNKNKIKPTEVTAGSHKKVWWKCLVCNSKWQSNIYSRTRGSGCPRCRKSKGEKSIALILDRLKIKYNQEYKFYDLNKYRFDFALFKKWSKKPYAIIEYHGRQHYEPVDFSGRNKNKAKNKFKITQNNDKIKKQYCIDNSIKYLEIPYWKKDSIEHMVRHFLDKQGVL